MLDQADGLTSTQERTMRPGTYRDKDGVLVSVARTKTGFTLTYPNGDVVVVGGKS